jgi:phage head maturation protease
MKREILTIGDRHYPVIRNSVKIGDWEEVKSLPVSAITKRDEDTDILDGIIIRGYEMEWNKTNENGERYTQDAFDKFIEEYFVEKGFNLIVDIEHAGYDPQWIAGRVIYAETNSRGFYYVAYIPKTYMHYDIVRNLLAEGILQGFSKMGYAYDYEWKWKEDGSFDYELIKEFKILAMSLVTAPANGIPFEKMQEIRRNGLIFRKVEYVQIDKENTKTLQDWFAGK